MDAMNEWLLIGERGKVAHLAHRTPYGWLTLCSRTASLVDRSRVAEAYQCAVCVQRAHNVKGGVCDDGR